MDPQAPPVVAVVVTADPGPWLQETLAGLAAQDYPNLSVLVIDAASSQDPTPRVASVLPGAYVRRLDTPVGYAAAANEALHVVEGAAFLLHCHDDVALDPDAVRQLVEEAYRSNAGVLGPKLVAWDDPSRLLQVGMAADKGGAAVPLVQEGELDQEQHDAVRDVFVVPGGAMLVRADLFDALGGYDPDMVLLGEDVDFCWRAQIAGARVIVVPAARGRHLAAASSGTRPLQALPGLPGGSDPAARLHALRRRHELAAALKDYGRWHLIRVAPQLIGHSLLEALTAAATGRPADARAAAGAWAWNLGRLGALRRQRRQVAACRTLPDSEVRRLQASAGARFAALFESAFSRAAAVSPFQHPERGWGAIPGIPGGGVPELELLPDELPTRRGLGPVPAWLSPAVWTGIVAVLLIGSRGLLGGGPPAIGTFPHFPSAGTLIGHYASGWRQTGLGQASPPPLAFALLGVWGYVLGGSMTLLRDVMTIGMLPIGAVGAYRLSRPLGSVRGRLVATVVYLAVPLPYSAIGDGRWAPLIAYGAAPWILGVLLRSTGLAPFAPQGSVWRRCLALGLLLAVVGAFVPGEVVATVLAGVALVLGSTIAGGLGRAARALATVGAGVVVAMALAFPWSVDLMFPGAQAAGVFGVPEPVRRASGLGALLGFRAYPHGSTWVGWAVLAAAALPLLFARGWRLTWAVRLWWVAIVAWAVAWAGGRGWLGVAVPEPGVLLGLAAAALSLAAGLGAVAFEVDLVGYGLGWRQAAALLAAVGVLAGTVDTVGFALGGRWGSPADDFRAALAPLGDAPRAAGGFRVLWVGDPEALPLPGWRLQDGVAFATSTDGPPDATDWWPGPDPGDAALAADALREAETGGTAQLGHLLAPMAVRYVVVPLRLAPAAQASRDLTPPPAVMASLGTQMDLRPIDVDPALAVYENVAWAPARAALDPGSAEAAAAGTDPLRTAASIDVSHATPVLGVRSGASSFTGRVPAGPVTWSAAPPGWRLVTASGVLRPRRVFGWASLFDVPAAGQASLAYSPGGSRAGALAAEAILWVAAVAVYVTMRRRRPRRDADAVPAGT
ncbi:MAG TPA: glycosyltransferase family 2 protein [Acidimicrobiales bacterium]|nr:glycosyltransferase family 2 protein [Acidimicrobiales bacterium]